MKTLVSKNSQSWLTWFLRGILILGLVILLARLFTLQIIKGGYYRKLSEGNRMSEDVMPAPRGKIYARGGEELRGPDFAHITGYLGETNEEEVGKIDPKCIQKGPRILGQIVGRGGLSEEYECLLSGVNGRELWETDSFGEKIRSMGLQKAIPGKDIRTSIDFPLQKEIARVMNGKSGAVIATDKYGKVLALYSSPSYNPDNVPQSLDDPDLPLFNRAIGGLYHPGSIFKPLIAASALEEKKIDADFTFNDTGVIEVNTLYGNYSYKNWYFTQYGGVEGSITLPRALARSTDTFFYKIGEMVGIENLLEWVKRFGLTTQTGIDIPGEIQSLIPTPEWKESVRGEKWFLGNTYHFSIGQGDLAVTPIGIHRSLLSIANMGKVCQLKIVGEPVCTKITVKKENIELIREGMRQACSDGGTGYTFFDFTDKHEEITVRCKTGTAETNEDEKTHAWFHAFSDDLVLTVMVEKSGEGSKIAGPIAREIFDYYYHE